jgi:hypothetical protein
MPFSVNGCSDKPLKSLTLPCGLFRRDTGDETIHGATKPFFAFGAELRKRPMVINAATNTAPSATGTNRRNQMRTMSIILAFAFVMAGTSMAGSAETGLPGIGTFSYNGSPMATPHTLVVAAR